MNIKKIIKELGVFTLAAIFVLACGSATKAQIAAWDFTGEASPATSTADVFNANLDSSNLITRGAGAAASSASNSFRTAGFQNNGISTANTDYFQITLSAGTGNTLSLANINARFAGTASYAASPGVTSQFAYSTDGTTFTLIGSPVTTIGTPATLPQIDLTGITALQNVPDGTTITLRYYASGQTTTGGWGFNSPSAGIYGLAIGGTVTPTGGGNSTTSDIVTAGGETPNINYLAIQSATVNTTADAVSVWAFTIRDGGASAPDADAFGTTLTSITFGKAAGNTVTNWANTIRQAALFDGATKIAETSVTSESITFSGLSVTAPDDGTKSLTLHLTFETTATDNQQFQFNVASANADIAGSLFTTITATSSIDTDNNRIEVTADRLLFVQQPPATVFVDTAITPAVTVQAADVNGRRDFDYTADVTISASGATLSNSSTTVATPTNGLASFNNIIFSTTGMGVTLNAASGALTGAVSDAFTVAPVPLLPAAGEIVINQFSSDYLGAADEYVEIINLTDKTFDLSVVRLEYQSANGTVGGAGGTLSGTLQPYSFFLLSTNATVTINGNSVNRDAGFSNGFAATAGQIALRRTTDNLIIDGLAYGTVPTNNLGEGAAAPAPPTDGGLRRDPDGDDTNVNSADFVTVANGAIRVRNSGSKFAPAGVPLAAGTYTDVTVAGNTTLAGNVTITGVLTLNGLLDAGANTLTINCGASVAGAGETAYVLGDVQKNFCDNTAFNFPVGQNGYSPVTVTPTNAPVAGTALTVDVEDAILPGLSTMNSVSRFWNLTETGDLAAELLFDYRAEDVIGTSESTFNIYKRNNSSPVQVPGTIDVAEHNALATPAISEFSDWGVGLLAPLAASSTVSGRVSNQDGRGLAYVDVTLTSAAGEVYTTTTGENGRYSFDDIPSGETYIISVQAKRYRFTEPSRVINLSENLTEINFTGTGR